MVSKRVATIDTAPSTLVVRQTEFRGQRRYDFRLFDAAGFPTGAGFALDGAKLLEFRNVVEAAIAEARAEGLLPKEGEKP